MRWKLAYLRPLGRAGAQTGAAYTGALLRRQSAASAAKRRLPGYGISFEAFPRRGHRPVGRVFVPASPSSALAFIKACIEEVCVAAETSNGGVNAIPSPMTILARYCQ